MSTASARSIEDIKSFISRQSDIYKVPYETQPKDRPRQCVFGGTSNAMDTLPLDRTGNSVTDWVILSFSGSITKGTVEREFSLLKDYLKKNYETEDRLQR